jgi:hypothetical protein
MISAGRCRLWMGRDHLLSVSYQWYAETYKRFYYRDIRAITLCKTAAGRAINLAAAGLLAALALLAAAGQQWWGWGVTGWTVNGFVSIPFALILLANTLLGPTCVARLQTAVHDETLPSLGRLWTARRALRKLRPRIEEAQGALSPAEIQANAAALPRLAAGAPREGA